MSVLINLLVVVTTAETKYQACPIDNYWFQILLSTRRQCSKARFRRSEAPKLPKLCRNPVQCAVAWGAGGLDWALSLVHTGPQLSADDTWATPAVPGQIKEWGYLLCTVDGEDWRCQIIGCLKSNLIFRASDIWHQPTKTVLADIKMQTCKHKDFLQFNDVDLSFRMIIQNWLSEMNESSEFVDRAVVNKSSGPTPCWSPALWETAGSLSRGTIVGKNKQKALHLEAEHHSLFCWKNFEGTPEQRSTKF